MLNGFALLERSYCQFHFLLVMLLMPVFKLETKPWFPIDINESTTVSTVWRTSWNIAKTSKKSMRISENVLENNDIIKFLNMYYIEVLGCAFLRSVNFMEL